MKQNKNEITGKHDALDKQLIKIPSQKIISLTDFSLLSLFFFLQKWKYSFVFFQCSLQVSIKKNYSTNESSLKYIYSCTIGLASEFMKTKKISASFYIKNPLYRYGLKRVVINDIKKDRKTAFANEILPDLSSLRWPVSLFQPTSSGRLYRRRIVLQRKGWWLTSWWTQKHKHECGNY